MARAFNIGVGMILVVKQDAAARVAAALTAAGERVFTVGSLAVRASPDEPEVTLRNLGALFPAAAAAAAH